MKPQIVSPVVVNSTPLGFRAAKAVARDRGVSDVTVWRWAQRGWIVIRNICGRPYVDLLSLAEFDRRVAAGEFAQKPSGAALKAHQTKEEKEAAAAAV